MIEGHLGKPEQYGNLRLKNETTYDYVYYD